MHTHELTAVLPPPVATGRRSEIVPVATRFRMPTPLGVEAGEDLVAIGADLEPGTMLAGQRRGLFPLPVDPFRPRSRLAWYSPDPRGVLPLDGLRVSRSLRRSLGRFDVRIDGDFGGVVQGCADPRRPGRWISDEFADAYQTLFLLGWAHSVEVYDADGLAGGLFGVRIGRCFAGVSMFHRATDASKVAVVHLVDWLRADGTVLLDVQWATPHLVSLGAVAISRLEYLRRLTAALD